MSSDTPTAKPADIKTTDAKTAPKVAIPVQRIHVMKFPVGTDRVTVYTDLPEPTYPNGEARLILEFRATRDTGREFCEKHFPGALIEEKEYK